MISRAHSIVGFRPEGRPAADYYPTPEIAVQGLLNKETFDGSIWEPACGQGHISQVLESAGYAVRSTDLNHTGYGDGGVDFLQANLLSGKNIVTNPPYKLAQQFVEKAITLRAAKAAFLLKLTFLEGVSRRGLFFYHPPRWIHVFSRRLKLARDGIPFKNSGMIAFAWFVWEYGFDGYPMVDWI